MTEESTDYFAAFFCLRGDVDNLALDEKGCFGLCDTQGREWICWQVDRESCRSEFESVFTDVPEMQETLQQTRILQHGWSRSQGIHHQPTGADSLGGAA